MKSTVRTSPPAVKSPRGRKPRDITGRVFGRLTVVGSDPDHVGRVLCRCECGASLSARRGALTCGNKKSCGCLRTEASSLSGAKMIAKNAADSLAERKRFGTNFGVIDNPDLPKNNKSGHKGVWYDRVRGTWDAYISVKHKRHNLGSYKTYAQAVEARDRAEERYFIPLIEARNAERERAAERGRGRVPSSDDADL